MDERMNLRAIRRASGVLALALLTSVAPARAEFVDPTWWVTGGPTSSLAVSGERLYVGGDFQYVGPNTGGFAALDVNTGALQPGWPRVDGRVISIAADGNGGWYLAGNFQRIAGVARRHVAHVRADGTLDAWNADPDTTVTKVVVRGATIYACGAFTKIGGQLRYHLAALDTVTGLATAWNPAPDGDVGEITTAGSTLYVGGAFSMIGGQTRRTLAAFDLTTGLVTSWNPDGNYDVEKIATSGSIAYVSGGFTHLGGQPRRGLAAIDLTTGLATPWAANWSGAVYAIAPAGPVVYVGGVFGGSPRNIAALDAVTGAMTSWNPRDSVVDQQIWDLVATIVPHGSQVFVGGSFYRLGRSSGSNLVALDAVTGRATAWNGPTNGPVTDLQLVGTTLFVAGSFQSAGGWNPGSVAALDRASGAALPWRTNSAGNVAAIVPHGARVDLGRSWWGDQLPGALVALDSTTALPTGWNPPVGSIVAMAANDTLDFVSGSFYGFPGQRRFGALSTVDGSLTAAAPDADGSVRAMAWNGSTLLLGGDFTQLGPVARSHLAALDPASGLATAWDPQADGSVHALAVDGTTVYVGGSFTALGGNLRVGIGAIDLVTGLPTPWHPGDAGTQLPVDAIRPFGNRVYVGGGFTTMGGQPRRYLAALDASTAAPTAWNPAPDQPVLALLSDEAALYVGGNFHAIGGRAVGGLARVLPTPAALPLVALLAPNGGEQVVAGSVRTITWNAMAIAPGVESVDLWISRNAGPWMLLEAGAPNTGSWVWHVDDATATHCRVRVDARDYAGGLASDVADGEFSIVTGNVAVSTPLESASFALAPVVPDPARGSALVRWTLARPAQARLTLHDLQGRELRTLAAGDADAGTHVVRLDTGTLTPGLYFVRITTGGLVRSRRFAVVH